MATNSFRAESSFLMAVHQGYKVGSQTVKNKTEKLLIAGCFVNPKISLGSKSVQLIGLTKNEQKHKVSCQEGPRGACFLGLLTNSAQIIVNNGGLDRKKKEEKWLFSLDLVIEYPLCITGHKVVSTPSLLYPPGISEKTPSSPVIELHRYLR